jgi:hypothetical protein
MAGMCAEEPAAIDESPAALSQDAPMATINELPDAKTDALAESRDVMACERGHLKLQTLQLEGFRSYTSKLKVGPFSDAANWIVGANGTFLSRTVSPRIAFDFHVRAGPVLAKQGG